MLDARQLDALAAVIEHGGFGPAAKALSLTLAAVSLRIKALEDQMGQRLLVRGKLVRATAAGQALLAHVKQVRMMETDLLSGLQGGGAAGAGAQAQGADGSQPPVHPITGRRGRAGTGPGAGNRPATDYAKGSACTAAGSTRSVRS